MSIRASIVRWVLFWLSKGIAFTAAAVGYGWWAASLPGIQPIIAIGIYAAVLSLIGVYIIYRTRVQYLEMISEKEEQVIND